MSTPKLPSGLSDTRTARAANRLHSVAIHLLRRARQDDRASGLTPERLSLLSVLVFAGPRMASELAEIEQVARPAVTRSLNGLERLGLLRRERSADDGRCVLVHATERGRRLLEEARRRRVERITGDLGQLATEDLTTVEAAIFVLERLGR